MTTPEKLRLPVSFRADQYYMVKMLSDTRKLSKLCQLAIDMFGDHAITESGCPADLMTVLDRRLARRVRTLRREMVEDLKHGNADAIRREYQGRFKEIKAMRAILK